jgi:hypothetical protein
VWINDGLGNFADSSQALGNSDSFDVALGDLDGDGDLDAWVANYNTLANVGQPNRVWINDGLGNFADSGQALGNSCSHGVALGDLDGDGDLDAWVANGSDFDGQPNRVWVNQGGIQGGSAGTFADSGQALGNSDSWGVALGDLDGDGDLDAWVANGTGYDSHPSLMWINQGGVQGGTVGTFADSGQALGNSNSHGVALGDLDGDGDLDAWVATIWNYYGSQANRVWINQGGATVNFIDSGQTLGEFYSFDVALGDLDGDGDLDAWVANHNGQDNHVLINDGLGNFADNSQALGNSHSHDVALGDFDGDGDLDAWVANGEGEPNGVWVNQGGIQGGPVGTFADNRQEIGNSQSTGVSIGDLDGDGDLDAWVANCCFQPNRVWINQGGIQGGVEGTFADSGQALGNSQSYGISLGDLDGDSDLDAWVANLSGANRVWINDGLGNFEDSGQALGNSNSAGVSLGDLDGDGDLDAWVANINNQANRVWINQGGDQGGVAGNYIDSGQALGSYRSLGVSLGDLDGDGDLDAWVANGNQPNRMWVNQGGDQGGAAGTFTDNDQTFGNSDSFGVALGDLDGDGDLDAWVANYSQANRVYLNNSCTPLVEDCTNGIDDDGDQLIDCDDPDCVGVNNLDVTCNTVAGPGNYTMNFEIVNNTPFEVHHGILPVGPIANGGVTLSPSVINFAPPLSPGGGSASVILAISGGGNDALPICFPVSLMSVDDATGDLFECCAFDVCTILPDCVACLDVTDELGTWVTPTSCQYDFLLHNEPGDLPLVAEFAYLVPTTPGITVTDNGIVLGGMIDGGAINLSTTISGATSGQEVCFLITLHDATLADCCGIQHCFTLPPLLIPPTAEFLRGDANADASFDLADVIDTLDFIFQGEPVPCLVALDSNDDEQVDIADGVFSLAALFTGGAEPAPPGLLCGTDETTGPLDCDSFPACDDDGSP